MRVFASVIVAVAAGMFVLGCGGDEPTQQALPEQVRADQRALAEEQPGQQEPAERAVSHQQSKPEEQDEARAIQGSATEEGEEPAFEPVEEEERIDLEDLAQVTLGAERPALLFLPADSGDLDSIALVLLLHGFGQGAESVDDFFGFSQLVDEHRFALLLPQGTLNADGAPFWNATPECCNFHGSTVDDVAYLSGLVDEARAQASVGPVYVIGLGNGGFMANRLACEGLVGLRAVVSVSASSFADPDLCANPGPMSFLQIHGTADKIVFYEGGLPGTSGTATPPGAVDLAMRWASRAGCVPEALRELPAIDLVALVDGAETRRQRWRRGCDEGVTVELWTMEEADRLSLFWWPKAAEMMLEWLTDEARIEVSD